MTSPGTLNKGHGQRWKPVNAGCHHGTRTAWTLVLQRPALQKLVPTSTPCVKAFSGSFRRDKQPWTYVYSLGRLLYLAVLARSTSPDFVGGHPP